MSKAITRRTQCSYISGLLELNPFDDRATNLNKSHIDGRYLLTPDLTYEDITHDYPSLKAPVARMIPGFVLQQRQQTQQEDPQNESVVESPFTSGEYGVVRRSPTQPVVIPTNINNSSTPLNSGFYQLFRKKSEEVKDNAKAPTKGNKENSSLQKLFPCFENRKK
ncbi:hypothetical protein DFA_10128 [Cavenderia fasciculata]|uniref:Uncharacterized protein n=1 Tax=Cavenderia fasciculata TaxID=261658 RepID=F4Q9C5_CACFS|nr:uncharacterized protein DFA_10128 [Cavenderia fasciculata]EGG15294.1 hypothetical protein DFA_10128 [Cavenderia fasciculata]|eukprot:XP_004352014.1 hypothetical protein DFA_10128 [Cavenderia fasciculata]